MMRLDFKQEDISNQKFIYDKHKIFLLWPSITSEVISFDKKIVFSICYDSLLFLSKCPRNDIVEIP